MIQTITIQDISNTTGDATTFVDIRPTAAFNGWALDGEPRAGHIPGALPFPVAWADASFDGELVDRLEAKGLTPADRIVVYAYDDTEARQFATRLITLGYDQTAVLDGGARAWLESEDLEVVRLARVDRLVYPDWLRGLLAGEAVPARPDGDVKVFHVNYGVPQDYARGHIPGAFHLDTNRLESSETWNRRSPEELDAALREFGITSDTPVVLYGNDTARDPREIKPGRRAGQIAATRAAAILMYAGVEDVRLLDGGFNCWRSHGLPVETELQTPEPVASFGATIPARPDVFVDYEEAQDLIEDPEGALVSIRSRAEVLGETSGYNYIEATGDIPGAVWANNGRDAYHMENYRNVDNTMRDPAEIAATWKGLGITPDKHVAFYCGTGWRASETFFYGYLMGWPRVSVYDGGWFEWSNRNGG